MAKSIFYVDPVSFFPDWMIPFPAFTADPGGEKICKNCGTSLSSVKKTGKFGCPVCYSEFSGMIDLSPFIGNGYRGKRLAEKTGEKENENTAKAEKAKKISLLREELARALAEEDYEKCARLRDEIKKEEA